IGPASARTSQPSILMATAHRRSLPRPNAAVSFSGTTGRLRGGSRRGGVLRLTGPYVVGFVATVALISVGSGCRRRSTEARPPSEAAHAQPANAYVDPSECARCHGEIARTFRLTGMGRSFSRARPDHGWPTEAIGLHHDASQ